MADFQTIHTALGLAAISAAVAAGTAINLTHMGVGDGNGMAVELSEGQTALVRETYRGAVNRVYQSPEHGGAFVAEFVVPASAGGFTMRELGIYTADGSLFAVGNLPDTYKPAAGSGAFSDAVLRMVFRVSNAEIVTWVVDPNVAVATQQWVTNNITIGWMLPGGTTGQYLRKKSNADGDTEWDDALEVTAHVDTIEEHQTLAASQTVVNLVQCTTRGLAIYIDGVRLANNEWTPDGSDDAKLTLGTSYAAGTILIAVQNEPSGASGAPLERSKNLSDVPDKAAARTNLGVMSAEDTAKLVPVGTLIYVDDTVAPPGYLKRNGANISRTTYAALFAKLGTRHSAGDGVTTFGVGDDRGEFLRGWDDGRGVDVGRALASAQGDAIRNITGTFDSNTNDGDANKTGAFARQSSGSTGADGKSGGGVVSFSAARVVPTANENRPRNKAYLVCIKY
jgi:phage-related tail fiber protein